MSPKSVQLAPFVVALLFSFGNAVHGSEVRIKSVYEFIDFKNNVNKGTSYTGTTVFLNSDIDFTGKSFEPIGNYSNYFRGVFDGQGHVINNLKMTSSSEYVGLFGYSRGLTIKNVIIDSSCSITSSYSGSDNALVGGIIGECYAYNGPCTIENSVNMGSVSFNGNISGYNDLYLGGIAGYLYSSMNDFTVKNCANYGDVTHSGTSKYSYIGGIIGEPYGSSSNRVYIYNSLNHGTITHNDTTSSNLYLGGIAGRTYYTTIENCVSAGKISSTKSNHIGSIVGYVSFDTYFNNCYYTSDLIKFDEYGYKLETPTMSNTLRFNSTSFQLIRAVSIGSYTGNSLIDVLNAYSDYYILRDYSHWILNKENNEVTFTINGRSSFAMESQVILLPSLASEGKLRFDGWYEDDGLTMLFTFTEVTNDTELYGRFEVNTINYAITFETRREGVSVAPITAQFGSVVTLPRNLKSVGCTLLRWETENGETIESSFPMPSHNITLYAVWKCTRIETPDDFIDFSKIVNSGTSYTGTTVFLDSDIDLTGKTFEPIGNYSNYFRGVFDGQGHVISNLKMTSSSQYVGLFGYSQGLTIKNVILDSSCSITSSYVSSYIAYIGGIIGSYQADNGPCTIENSVNMASVTFDGDTSSDLNLGGIAGELYFSDDSIVKNCANYGDVTHSGTSKYSYIGGIIGEPYGSSSNRVYIYIYNSLNHGTITHNGTTSSNLYLGGIAGRTYYTTIENCVSAGKISSTKSNHIGSIVGYVDSYTSIKYCYFTSDLSSYSKYGSGTPSIESNVLNYDNTSFKLNESVSIENYTGTSLIDALNVYADYYILRDYSHWILNKENNEVTFTINGRSSFAMESQVILLPSLASEGKLRFDGWYEDDGLTMLFTFTEVTNDTELYGRFEVNTINYAITFETRREGVSVAPITAQFGSVVTLPSGLTKSGCTIRFWENVYGDYLGLKFTMSSHNITLYAVWKCTRIETTEDLIDFSKVVNDGANYKGTTVFLDSDLDFTGESFEPIGDYYNYFRGVFDGQGHVISNLEMTSSSQYVGLFGYSRGLTIKNVILDSSCSITSSFRSDDAYVGGIIGDYYASEGPCIIENSVNMASVTFDGDTSSSMCLGGIVGYHGSSYDYSSTVKNCANYGDVTHSGTSDSSYIGGIVGKSYGSTRNRVYIYNSLNHGTITHNGTTSSNLYLGGIAGWTYYTTIENCVSGEKITSTPITSPNTNYIGNIVGYVSSDTSINYCYFTNKLSSYSKYGSGTPSSESNTLSYDSTSFELNGTVSIGSYTSSSLTEALNSYSDYHTLRDYSHWLLNKENNEVSFSINGKTLFAMESQVILLPSLASGGKLWFDGWYKDSGLTTPHTEPEISSDTELYGRFEEGINYTISFDTRREGVFVAPITAPFGSVVTLPSDSIREHCAVGLWENKYSDKIEFNFPMPSHNITLYAVWKCTRIETPDDLISFSKIVNSGTSYTGTTVFLDSDLDFTGKTLEPIGNYSNYFRGVFDGQGHVISNLTMTSSSQYAGLFGHSKGLTIRNAIIDSSCSFTSTYSGSDNDAYVGGIIGECIASNGHCTIENSVNMASVTFSGDISGDYLYLGGISGYLYSSSNYEFTVKNCTNYGDVTHFGESMSSYIGGIAGDSYGYSSSSNRVHIYNCLNHDTISHNGTTTGSLYLGGIIGRTRYTTIENCVSAGKISSTKTNYIGSIVGYSLGGTTINYCYFTSKLSSYSKYGSGTPSSESNTLSYDSTSFELNGTVSIGNYKGTSLIGSLNAVADYYVLRDYSHWLLNKENNEVSFTINGRTTPIKVNYQIILLPSLAREGNMSFDGWYKDSGLTTPLTSYEITRDTNLYGRFEEGINYTIFFDTRREGVIVAPITAPFGSVVTLPSDLTRGHYAVTWWENMYGNKMEFSFTMPSHNITLYAVWKCTRIETPEDLIVFSKSVNKGVSYSGTTVFLDSGLDFTGKTFEPIGYSYSDSISFRGVFDGQGHLISNLTMTSSSQYVGLFGYSYGLTIKNVVLDSSCSITSSYDSGHTYVGGIIGGCYASKGPCTIENSVNIGSVTFDGDTSSDLYLGGIAGEFYFSSNYDSIVKNCANYGDIIHSGTSKYSYIGGIAGNFGGSSKSKRAYIYIYNSLNHGTITHNGTTSSNLYLGGIAGETQYTTIENCVSAGEISTNNSTYAGSIVGYVDSYTSIKYCYFTSKLSGYEKYGERTPSSESNTPSYNSTTFELSGTVSIGGYSGNFLIGALNSASDYHTIRDYSHWLLNKNKKDVSFSINEKSTFILNSQIILLPSLASGGNVSFDGWYEDKGLTVPFTFTEVTNDTELYGKFEENTNNYTISFDTWREGVSVASITAQFGSVVQLPSDLNSSSGYPLAFWETENGDKIEFKFTMLPHNITLYAVWKCTRIETLDDFIDFSKIVNNDVDYSGTTVFLDSDLDFTGESFEPIGDYYNYFLGTFNGQGHMISNLVMNSSSSQYVGLFGYSRGLTIRNVILDSSCSITSSFSGSDDAYVGGIIGDYYASEGPCNIENSVNMGSVSFGGDISSSMCLGGIVGYHGSSSNYYSTLKNCANYGDVTHSGTSDSSYIGGVVGHSGGSSHKRVYIYNSLNHGTITHNGTTSISLYLGGIAGETEYSTIENCVSGGMISSTPIKAPSSSYVGSIAGYIYSVVSVNYCYFASNTGISSKYGKGTPSSDSNTFSYDSTTFQLGGTVSIGSYKGSSLIEAINSGADYHTLRDYSHWAFNKENKTVSFTINGKTNSINMDYQIILLPSLASEGKLCFDGWYTDSEHMAPLTSYEIINDIELYGKFDVNTNNYTISFDTRGEGVFVAPITAPFDSTVTLPSNLKSIGCTLLRWETENGETIESSFPMPSHNITLYAVWKCTRIETPEDLIDFSKVVNSGTSYTGTTVFLGSDIDFTGKTFEPIGTSSNSNFFRGVFDGQGHVISNLTMTYSSSRFAGLFGFSRGLIVRNVILDSSCSITNSYVGSDNVYVGGIIGYCYADYGDCTVENSVNMGRVSFSGTLRGNDNSLYLGGIAGYLYYRYYESTIKNCANYGDVTHSGTSRYSYIGGIAGTFGGSSSKRVYIYNSLNHGTITHNGTTSSNLHLGGIAGYTPYTTIENCANYGDVTHSGKSRYSYIGGIVGFFGGSSANKGYIYNCLNHGTITHNGTTSSNLHLGGITGYTRYTAIENCVSGGKISSTRQIYIGSIVGYAYSGTSINYCYYTSDTVISKIIGTGSATRSNTPTSPSNPATILNKVNRAVKGWNKWLLNQRKSPISFKINDNKGFTLSTQFILFPDINAIGNNTFSGWYKSTEYNELFQSTSVTAAASFYGLYGIIRTVAFNPNSGSSVSFSSKKVVYGCKYETLPRAIKTYYTLTGWFTEKDGGEEVTSESKVKIGNNHTLYAHWSINQYTITFEVDGGSECENITQDYNTNIVLPEPTKTGYTFDWWCSDPELSKEYTETKMPAENVTLYAKWKINKYTLTFIFNSGAENEVRTLDFNEVIVYPENVEKPGYTFNGWVNKPDRMPAENITITAQWTANKYIVTFDVNGGNPLSGSESKKEVTYDSPYGEFPTPNRTGYGFDGWFTEVNGGDKIESATVVKITNPQTLYAHWTIGAITVKFNAMGGVSSQSTKSVFPEDEYGDLPEATKTGFSFIGWFTEEEGGDEVTNETDVEAMEDHALYAHWSINKYTITFEVNAGSECKAITQDYNTKVVLPEPTKTGYTFDCWCSDSELSRVYTETTMPAGNVTLYAKWIINQYTLTFDFKNDAGDEVRTLDFNEEIVYPENVEKTGYTFNGWDNKPDRMPAENITITSLWTINQYTLTIIFNNGTEPEVRIINYNSTIGYPTEPVKEGHTFNGWSHTTEFMPAHNLTITALWTANKYIITFVFDNGNEPEKRTFDYNSTIAYPENVTKEGYVFDKWDSNITVMPSHDLTITAQWMGCMVTIVFDTKEFKEAEVEDKIREIIGGSENVIIEFVTDEESGSVVCIIKFVDQISSESISTIMENITSNEGLKHIINYVEVDGEEWASKDNTVLTVVIVAVVVVVISVLLAVPEVLLIWRRRAAEKAKAQRGAINRVVEGRADAVDSSKFKSRFRKSKKIYPKKYDGPTGIVDALMSAGVDRESAVEASEECKRSAEVSCENGYIAGDFTLDDAAAVCLYTFDFGDDRYDINPYRLLNKALRADKHKIEEIVKVRDVLYLIMTALRKLPVVSGVTLYRGIRSKVNARQYKEGSVIIWSGFSSTSPDMNTTKAFLNTVADENEKKKRRNEGTGSENGSDEEIEMTENPNGEEEDVDEENSGGTLFIIEDGWGYNVQPYSQFPEEEEILLEPEREFEVMSVTESENLVLVTLKMRKTKPILTKVFGKRRIYKRN